MTGSPIRIAAALLVLAGAGCSSTPKGVEAIPQERKLIDRIMSPDMSLTSDVNGRTFYPGKKSTFSKDFHTKEFHYVNRARTKQVNPGSYQGVKSAGDASRGYATSQANTETDRVIENVDRDLGGDTYATSTARDAGEKFETKEIRKDDFRVRGKAQGSLDLENPMKPGMSIDEVRAILNRSE